MPRRTESEGEPERPIRDRERPYAPPDEEEEAALFSDHKPEARAKRTSNIHRNESAPQHTQRASHTEAPRRRPVYDRDLENDVRSPPSERRSHAQQDVGRTRGSKDRTRPSGRPDRSGNEKTFNENIDRNRPQTYANKSPPLPEDDTHLFASHDRPQDMQADIRERREELRFSDNLDVEIEDSARNEAERQERVVDADWEDVEDQRSDTQQERTRHHGDAKTIRTKRRRETALVRPESTDNFDANYFDDEFFADLRVQPKALAKALKKARRRAESREKNRLTPLRLLGWSLWIGAVTATLFAVITYRNEIVRIWPSSAGAYAVIGIEANPYGLTIESVHHRLAISTAGPTIEITGSLRNEKDTPTKAPLLQAEALGPRGELLSRWTFEANAEDVLAGGSIDFITRAPAPEGIAEVALSFAPEKGGVVSVDNFLTRRDK